MNDMREWISFNYRYNFVMKSSFFVMFVLLSLFFVKPAQAALSGYYIEGVIDSNTLLISRNSSFYKVDFDYPCSFSKYSDSGKTIFIDSYGKPLYGSTVVYEKYGTITCETRSSETITLTPYIIESTPSFSDVIIYGGGSYYKTSFDYGCTITSLDYGKDVYISSFLYPSYGDLVLFPNGISQDLCTISTFLTEKLHIKPYTIINEVGYDRVIVEDQYGSKYPVQYGIGCYGLTTSTGTIYIDSTILDGISDTIYLFDKGQSCKVWDADYVTTRVATPTPLPPNQAPTSPSPAPTEEPQVLGAITYRPTMKTPKLINGVYSFKLDGETIKINPFGSDYKGTVWSKSVDFGPDGKIFIFINSKPNKRGQIRIFKTNGKLLKAYNPYGEFSASGLNALAVVESNDEVYLAVSSTKAATTVKTYRVTANGLRTLNNLTAISQPGNILLGFRKLYKNQYGLVTKKYGDNRTLKVWKLNLVTNRFIEDKKINKTKIKF